MNKKRIIVITIAIIIIIVIGIVIFLNMGKENNKISDNKQTEILDIKGEKTSQLYKKIEETKTMTFSKKVDDNNKVFIAIKDDKGYKELTVNGITQKYIVKDGDTFYLDENNKKYYRYQSNDTILTEIKEQFENFYNKDFSEGKEKLEGKNYNYEEVLGYQDFLFNYDIAVNDLQLAKTKLYYDGGNLAYIKTNVGDNEELLKVDISFKSVNNNYFEIPENYSNGEE